MKRNTFWLLTVSFIFILGLTAALIYLKFFYPTVQTAESVPEIVLPEDENNPADLPVLAFCELVNNPEKYDGRTVRVSARLFIGTENSWFSDARCGTDNVAIISSKSKEVWTAIDKAATGKNKEFRALELNMTVIGKFENVPFKYCCTIAPFQFEILKVENVSKVN